MCELSCPCGAEERSMPREKLLDLLAHQLADEVFFAGHTHFIRRIQFDGEHTLDRRLAHCRNLCALHMLAQQHAEHRRNGRIFTCGLDKVHTRRTGCNRD